MTPLTTEEIREELDRSEDKEHVRHLDRCEELFAMSRGCIDKFSPHDIYNVLHDLADARISARRLAEENERLKRFAGDVLPCADDNHIENAAIKYGLMTGRPPHYDPQSKYLTPLGRACCDEAAKAKEM